VQLLNDSLVLAPSDLAETLECDHLVQLDIGAATGDGEPRVKSESNAVVARRGDEHEQRYLESLKDRGLNVTEIKTAGWDLDGALRAQEATLEAMRSGVDVVYQATFLHGRWQGRSDFLERVEAPSELGSYSYEVVDTKLARNAKVSAILQISNYSEHVARLQGATPKNMHLILGDGTRVTFLVHDFDAYYRAVKRHLESTVDKGYQPASTYPDPVAHCSICSWAEKCEERRLTDDHLSLVARITRGQIERLREHGIGTEDVPSSVELR
jgi:predicted RecB family nuclease